MLIAINRNIEGVFVSLGRGDKREGAEEGNEEDIRRNLFCFLVDFSNLSNLIFIFVS